MIYLTILEPENELCKLKGHMWYVLSRKEVKKDDGRYSVPDKLYCSRCGITKNTE